MPTITKAVKTFVSNVANAALNLMGIATPYSTSVLAWVLGYRELWPTVDQRSAIERGYADNTALYSIINKDVMKFAAVPRYVYDAATMQEGKSGKPVTGDQYKQLVNLLKNPNPVQGESEFYELIRIYFKACGESFIWLNRGDVAQKYIAPIVDSEGILSDGYFVDRTRGEIDQMPVLQMYVFAPGFVGVIPDRVNMFVPEAYWLEAGGQKRIMHKNDVIHWKRTNPVFDPTNGTHLRGLSPLKVGRRTVQENEDATASSDRMFKNDGAKGVMVNKNLNWNALPEEQKQNIRDVIDNHINNNDVKGAVATLGGDWSYLNLAASSIDMQLLEGKKFTWQELCFLLDTPYELFDPSATWSNKEQALKWFAGSVIAPACKSLDEKMTNALAKAFGFEGKIIICSDVSAIPEMKADTSALILSYQNAWYITPNAKLASLGFEPVNNPLFDEPWVPVGLTPLSQVSNDADFANQNPTADGNGSD